MKTGLVNLKRAKCPAHVYLALLILIFSCRCNPTLAMDLITPAEASLPAVNLLNVRGPVPGPEIQLISPAPTAEVDGGLPVQAMTDAIKAPFSIVLRFIPHGGAKIDVDTLSLKYIKNPFVDLTQRVRPYTSLTGVNIVDANMPAGEHLIRVQIKDTRGRLGTAFIKLRSSE